MKTGDLLSSRYRLLDEIGASLARLRTEWIDVYQVHWPDPLVPIEETAEAMRGLYERGLIRAIGVSNFSPAQMDVFRQVAPLHVAQPPYNLFEHAPETAETQKRAAVGPLPAVDKLGRRRNV